MKDRIKITSERVSQGEYIDFLKRTDLGSQYPKERFDERIEKLVNNVSISIVARNEDNLIVGVLFDRLRLLALRDRFGSGQKL